ncbi:MULTISPECIES: Spy/CpxP family protein refolding chaperone [unclassified Bradyrhizobium]|uniref:Spy/CpxP family protein refolding chaperone n=2 Tax=Nitrobacteraceae TaxID=41294 RepID=UPI0006847D24|nr:MULTISPECIES: Spy/CpxP family protein refolding chaperone [unclassified Bradyrhizobium]MCK1268866.1 Spy/CpxP family protein refolding chaperone [Bradyrhizobium sp. 84]MCK1305889.1 Spy/CpxP family protein refolding chaperone [Bradyrhizobium sp. 45]MCK1319576.1 Spy/CpxP family protein refolding chaperone [Bradyrhizobium sp. 156]MCK1328467.1 Spy/CpxP family protein refolding chaperone [Bradyrhizobium sp. CW9]MCK1344163.1 Spy/CpxP family protein refolding chaperone [Bradyrhizobium sp. CW11]
MSRSRLALRPRLGLALSGVTLVILAVLLPGRAEAQFGFRGGPLGVARFAVGHMIGMSRLRHARMAVRGSRYRSAALRSQDPRGAERGQPANPYVLRAAMTAQAALSGWRGGRRPQGWWRHPDGSYGWVGPVFWPFAHDDLTTAIILGDTTSLSLYGYGDIYAAIFAPYAATELAAYTTPQGRRGRRVPTAETVCDASDTGGLPVDRIAAAVQPNELQRTALDELATAWASARDTIRAACPTQVPAMAIERLGLMRERIEAMIKATDAVAPSLAKFLDLLDDDQKAKLDGLAKERRAALASIQQKNPEAASACQADSDPRYDEKLQRQYEQLVQQQWPAAEIASTLKLDDTARARLDVLQDTTLRTMETLSACPSQAPPTPQARLTAVKARLQTMLQAVNGVSDALDDFEADLSDEQKAGFEAIGPKRGV